ncbi:TrmH family RNA methyltransferase [Oikeobacillus pervagus]|uniref:TrmH family RNA methyltransferase n=1 Tax=Oikeobacillus pervagus TaxID=1325931 RepID=A0AAJ1T2F6_9BACI|nr:RNA methyltransferase [Oikeobacillus pervagus]MDQ0215456.1 TrmH family RNA methyltransferase [Oikeobacillus pervagus]
MDYIQSAKNPKVKQWKKLLTKKGREQTGLYLLEGFHLVEEALQFKNEIEEILYSENIMIPSHWNMDHVKITTISEEVSKAISETESSQGIFAICKKHQYEEKMMEKGKSFLLIDAVQDPGNVGTMIRTADAAGIDLVILGDGTVDLYNSKVLRSAQGSHFHLSIISMSLQKAISLLQEKGVPVFGTSLQSAESYKKVTIDDSFAMIVGNEGNGVSEELLQTTNQNVFIPLYGRSESLNVAVAAGILLFHFQDSLKSN